MMAIDQPLPDGPAVADQRATVSIGQRQPLAQFAAEDPAFLPQEVILVGEVFAERLLDSGDQRNGRVDETRLHSLEDTQPTPGPHQKEEKNRRVWRTDEYLHGTGLGRGAVAERFGAAVSG